MQRKMRGVVAGAVAGACAASMALAASGCTLPGQAGPTGSEPTINLPFDPSNEMVETVYGPPPEFENYPAPNGPGGPGGPGDPGMETFDPSLNQNEDVYGPPEMFDPYGYGPDGGAPAPWEQNRDD